MQGSRMLLLAAALEVFGLVLQMITLVWFSPYAMMVQMGIGVPLVGAGILVFLVYLWGNLTRSGAL